MNTQMQPQTTAATGFTDLSARDRVRSLLDPGTMRELLTPFDRLTSPWLEKQGVVPQFDDGVVIARGKIDGQNTLVAAIEGSFQGGSLGEVGGAKIAGALELAIEENRNGNPTSAVLVLETGGVRLQEANLGLAAIADIQSAIVELRAMQPVVAVITGPVGCFGGMSISAGLCSYLIMTREGRLGLNGPQVIEQEAGVNEYDSRDRGLIWGLTGGEQRFQCGLIDQLVAGSVGDTRSAVVQCLASGIPEVHPSEAWLQHKAALQAINMDQPMTPSYARQILQQGGDQ